MEYRVVASTTRYRIEVAVNEAIKEGWVPFGNLVVIPEKGLGKVEGITEHEIDPDTQEWARIDYQYFQPMILDLPS